MDLSKYKNEDFDRGRNRLVEFAWLAVGGMLFDSWLPGSAWRVAILRLFGSSIGCCVVIKPRVKIKFPWRLSMGDRVWLGESAWIDNLDFVNIGSDVCISQNVYLCTGSHDWSEEDFQLVTGPIEIEDHSWICANASICPGVKVGQGAVLGLGSTASKSLDAWTVYSSRHAESVRARRVPNRKA